MVRTSKVDREEIKEIIREERNRSRLYYLCYCVAIILVFLGLATVGYPGEEFSVHGLMVMLGGLANIVIGWCVIIWASGRRE